MFNRLDHQYYHYGHVQYQPPSSSQRETEDARKQLHFQTGSIAHSYGSPSAVTLSPSGAAVRRTAKITGLRKGANVVTLGDFSSGLEKSSLKIHTSNLPAGVSIKRTPITRSCTPASQYKSATTTNSVSTSGILTPQSECPSEHIEAVWSSQLHDTLQQHDQSQKSPDVAEITELEMAAMMNDFKTETCHLRFNGEGFEGRIGMLREEAQASYRYQRSGEETLHLHLFILVQGEYHEENKLRSKNHLLEEDPDEGLSVRLDISYGIKEQLWWSPKASIDIDANTERGFLIYEAICHNLDKEGIRNNCQLTLRADLVELPLAKDQTYFSHYLRVLGNNSGSCGLENRFRVAHPNPEPVAVKGWIAPRKVLQKSTASSVRDASSASVVEFFSTSIIQKYSAYGKIESSCQLAAFTVPITLMHYCVPEFSPEVHLQALIQSTRCPIMQCPLEVKLDGYHLENIMLPDTPRGGCAEIYLGTDTGFTVELQSAMRISLGDGSFSNTLSVRVVNNGWARACLLIGRDFPVVEGTESTQKLEATVEDFPGRVAQNSSVDLDRVSRKIVYRMVLVQGEERTVICKYVSGGKGE